jgi:hypothetical protein
MRTVYHADLSDALAGEDYWVHARGKRYPLVPHTPETLARLRTEAPHLSAVPNERLTHFTETPIELPDDCVVRVHIKHTLRTFPNAKGKDAAHHAAIHNPRRFTSKDMTASVSTTANASNQQIDWVSTAKALVFHHADLINSDPDATAVIYQYMDDDEIISSAFEQLASVMRQMGTPTETSGWALLEPYTPPENPETGQDGVSTYYFNTPQAVITDAAGPVTTMIMKATKHDLRLQDVKWSQQEGTAVDSSSSGEPAMLASIATDWTPSLQKKGSVSGLKTKIKVTDASKMQVQITFENTEIRYLAAYIRFWDAEGKALSVPDWTPNDPPLATTLVTDVLDVQYDDMRYLGYISPVNNLMAVPITSDPGKLTVSVTFPPNAVSATVYGSGLGTGSDQWPKSPMVGGVLTGVMNLGVPAFMLGYGVAAQNYKTFYNIVDDLMAKDKFLIAVVLGGSIFFGAEFTEAAVEKDMNWTALSILASLLFEPAAMTLLVWVESTMAAEEAAEQIPYAGWILAAINIATGTAQLAETILAVSTAPWNIANKISTSITTQVEIQPDPRHGAFPVAPAGETATYTVKMIYKDDTRPTVSNTYTVPADSTATTLAAAFPENTLGGQVKFEADYYIGTWLAAKATTGWMENDERTVALVKMIVVQFPIPLDEKSIYQHTAILTYQNGAYLWQPSASAPTATIANRNSNSSGNAISDWTGLTLSQRNGMLGAAWKAAGTGLTSCASGQSGQLYALLNVDIPGKPMNGVKFSGCGFDAQSTLMYDPYPPKFQMQDGQWVLDAQGHAVPDPNDTPLGNYYIDPRNAAGDPAQGGGYHIRAADIEHAGSFPTGGKNQTSYGRFPYFPDSFALHPSGLVIGVSAQYSKIMIAQLPATPAADINVPMARTYGGEALNTDRAGLLFHPVGVTCAYDGTTLILEDTKSSDATTAQTVSRIQAFDLNGNPVSRFQDAAGNPSPFLYLDNAGSSTYLDIAAVGDDKMTYIYVLHYDGDGASAAQYHLTIYQYSTERALTNPLVTTSSFSAAKIAVDLWHTVYSLNYEMTTDGHGKPAGPASTGTGPAGRTVPSISEWLPPVQE